MPYKPKKRLNPGKKDSYNTKIRKKLGITQGQLASMFNHSRAYITMVESGKRNLRDASNSMLANIYLQFHELETGKQATYRSLETRLFLNDQYKKILPGMKALEQECRRKLKELKNDMAAMKERARDAENAIIVFTTAITHLQENGKNGDKTGLQLTGLGLLKQQAYDNLLTCWEPEQAKLHSKIEAIAGEAKALRRYRIKVIREHNPFKK